MNQRKLEAKNKEDAGFEVMGTIKGTLNFEYDLNEFTK